MTKTAVKKGQIWCCKLYHLFRPVCFTCFSLSHRPKKIIADTSWQDEAECRAIWSEHSLKSPFINSFQQPKIKENQMLFAK